MTGICYSNIHNAVWVKFRLISDGVKEAYKQTKKTLRVHLSQKNETLNNAPKFDHIWSSVEYKHDRNEKNEGTTWLHENEYDSIKKDYKQHGLKKFFRTEIEYYIIDRLFTKQKDWEHEKEIRLLVSKKENDWAHRYLALNNNTGNDSLGIQLETIIFGRNLICRENKDLTNLIYDSFKAKGKYFFQQSYLGPAKRSYIELPFERWVALIVRIRDPWDRIPLIINIIRGKVVYGPRIQAISATHPF